MDSIDLLTTKELAAKLSVTVVTIRRWVKAGKFPAPLNIGENTVRWRESTVSKWLDDQVGSTDPESAAMDIQTEELAETFADARAKLKKGKS